jgi:hypothetical protein
MIVSLALIGWTVKAENSDQDLHDLRRNFTSASDLVINCPGKACQMTQSPSSITLPRN